MASRLRVGRRPKHLETKSLFALQLIKDGLVVLETVHTKVNTADMARSTLMHPRCEGWLGGETLGGVIHLVHSVERQWNAVERFVERFVCEITSRTFSKGRAEFALSRTCTDQGLAEPKTSLFFTQTIIFHGGTAILSSLFFVVKSGPLETFSEPCEDGPVVLVDLGLALACVSDGETAAVISRAGGGEGRRCPLFSIVVKSTPLTTGSALVASILAGSMCFRRK